MINSLKTFSILATLAMAMSATGNVNAASSGPGPAPDPLTKPRIVVLTDIGTDPDNEESLVRLLVYSNEFDIEGLIATVAGASVHDDLIRDKIEAYRKDRPNLVKHALGYPDPDALLAVTKVGNNIRGIGGVGPGLDTPGTLQIIADADKPDSRPLWISIGGSATALAQALYDVRATRSPADVTAFVAKLRVYSISDQDDAGPWIRKEFPGLFYVVTPSSPYDWFGYYAATWTGISGDKKYKVGLSDHFDMVDNPWIDRNIIKNHGALGAAYPPVRFIMEEDTPSFLGLIDNGLGWSVSPGFGGWGGRYVNYQPATETHPIWTNNMFSRDTVTATDGRTETSDQATIWRWREAFQNDFAARMSWCTADSYGKANHNPIAVLNGDTTTKVLTIDATGGTSVTLSADGTTDPDGDKTHVKWWIYQEAGTLDGASLSKTDGNKTEVTLPVVKNHPHLHVIMEVEDNGKPHLFSYRRAIINVSP